MCVGLGDTVSESLGRVAVTLRLHVSADRLRSTVRDRRDGDSVGDRLSDGVWVALTRKDGDGVAEPVCCAVSLCVRVSSSVTVADRVRVRVSVAVRSSDRVSVTTFVQERNGVTVSLSGDCVSVAVLVAEPDMEKVSDAFAEGDAERSCETVGEGVADGDAVTVGLTVGLPRVPETVGDSVTEGVLETVRVVGLGVTVATSVADGVRRAVSVRLWKAVSDTAVLLSDAVRVLYPRVSDADCDSGADGDSERGRSVSVVVDEGRVGVRVSVGEAESERGSSVAVTVNDRVAGGGDGEADRLGSPVGVPGVGDKDGVSADSDNDTVCDSRVYLENVRPVKINLVLLVMVSVMVRKFDTVNVPPNVSVATDRVRVP